MDINPYIGGEAKVDGVSHLVRLASNENALGCSDKAKEEYQNLSENLHRYPDGMTAGLRDALAKHHGLEADKIVCGAGSDELISLLLRSYAGVGDEVLYSQHGFLMYPIGAKAVGATPVSAPEKGLRTDIDSLLSHVTEKTKLLFLANPNNPTGSYITRDELRSLREQLRDDVLLIIDSAYAEFVEEDDYTAGEDLVREFDNIVMLRTFSKIHGLAALRLGWAYCSDEVSGVLNRVRGPFNVNAPAQIAGIAALNDKEFIERSITHNTKWRNWLSEKFQELGYGVHPSVGNFILVDFGDKAEDMRLKLRENGIFIRQMGAYGLPDCLRITVGTEEENNILVDRARSFKI